MEVINTSGRRKTSIARIYMRPGKGEIIINNRTLEDYFPTSVLQIIVNQPFNVSNKVGKYDVDVNVKGGGLSGQAESIRLAIAKALCETDGELKSALRKEGFVTRDPRMVERKKYGKKKARRSFQFSKR